MNAIVLSGLYPAFETDDSEVTRSLRGEANISSSFRSQRDSRIPSDVSLLERVVLEEDVKILSRLAYRQPASNQDVRAYPEVLHLLSGKTLLPSFGGTPAIVRDYSRAYNGVGLRAIVRRLSGANLSTQGVTDLLASILEDALLATASHLRPTGQSIAAVRAQDEPMLQTAIAERLPRVYNEDGYKFARDIIQGLKETLGSSKVLAIDDGAVILVDQELRILNVGPKPIKLAEL